jgi:hypothetical protein
VAGAALFFGIFFGLPTLLLNVNVDLSWRIAFLVFYALSCLWFFYGRILLIGAVHPVTIGIAVVFILAIITFSYTRQWCSFLIVYFTVSIFIIFLDSATDELWSDNYKPFLGVGFITISLFCFALPDLMLWCTTWQRPTSYDRVGVWVTAFRSDDDQKVQARIVEELSNLVRQDPSLRDFVEIRESDRIIHVNEDEEIRKHAQSFGRRYGASFVIVGRITAGRAFLTIVDVDMPQNIAGVISPLILKIPDFDPEDLDALASLTRAAAGMVALNLRSCVASQGLFEAATVVTEMDAGTEFNDLMHLLRAESIKCAALQSEKPTDGLDEAAMSYKRIIHSGAHSVVPLAWTRLGALYVTTKRR